MMVLVAVAIGVGWLYSVAATFFIEGDVFYEAAGMLATFVLLGHWFEMRARGGANDAIRALLDLAPPKAVVLRDGEPVEVPTAEVQVGDLLLIRPGCEGARRRRRRGGRERGRRVHRDRREPARPEDRRRPADRRDDQQERHPARPRDRRRLRHRARADRQARPGGTELQGARAAPRRPRRLLARARRARGRRADLRRLVLRRRARRSGRAAVRHHRRRHHLPGRARAGDPDGHHGRHRAWAPSAASSSSTRSRSSRPPRSTPSCSTRPAP